ncbi:MAG: hypothetical protein U0Z44_14020 [Kouleothrix sp.]
MADSTSIALPDDLAAPWPGMVAMRAAANLKCGVQLDLLHGTADVTWT